VFSGEALRYPTVRMPASAVFALIYLNVRFLHVRSTNCNDEVTPRSAPLLPIIVAAAIGIGSAVLAWRE
jgi:hypothetical protein